MKKTLTSSILFILIGFNIISIGFIFYKIIKSPHEDTFREMGCSRDQESEVCDYIDKEYEQSFENTPITPLPEPKPIFLNSETLPMIPKFKYVYVRDDRGVWVRFYNFEHKRIMEFLVSNKDIDGYDYTETIIPHEHPETYNDYKQRHIQLNYHGQPIYQQVIHELSRYDIWSPHYSGGTIVHKPTKALENLAQSQVAILPNIPNYLNRDSTFQYNKEENSPLFSGNLNCSTDYPNEFQWKNKKNMIRMRLRDKYNNYHMICGIEYNLILSKSTDDDNNLRYCYRMHILPAKEAYHNFMILDGFNNIFFRLKQGHDIYDAARYQFSLNQHRNNVTQNNDWKYEISLYDKKGNLINEPCTHVLSNRK